MLAAKVRNIRKNTNGIGTLLARVAWITGEICSAAGPGLSWVTGLVLFKTSFTLLLEKVNNRQRDG